MQLISDDPLQRKTFAYLEDDWHDEMNNNLVKTVDQINDLQEVVVGSDSESALTGYSADSVKQRISDLEAAVNENDTDISNIQNDVDGSVEQQTLIDSLGHLAVGIAQNSTGSAISLQSGSNMPLKDGDELIVNDLTNDTVQQVVVSGDTSEGSTSVSLTSALGSDVAAGAVVTLYPADMRSGLDADRIKGVLWGSNDPADISTDHESRLQTLNNRVGDVQNRIRSVESIAASVKDDVRDVEGTVTQVRTTAEQASLEAKKLQVTDTKILELTSAIDLDSNGDVQTVDSLEVRVNPDLPSSMKPVELETSDILAMEVKTGNGVKILTLGTDPANYDGDGNLVSIDLSKSYEIHAANKAGLFMTSSTVASRVSARTNGNVSVRGDLLKSTTFDGSIVEKADGFNYVETDSEGRPLLGSTGWALTDGGDLAASNAFLRGKMDIVKAYVEGKLGMGPSATIVAQDPTDTDPDGNPSVPYYLSRRGVSIEAVYSPQSTTGRALRIQDDNLDGSDMARIRGVSEGNRRVFELRTSANTGPPSELKGVGDKMQLIAKGQAGSPGTATLRIEGRSTIHQTTPAYFLDSAQASGPDALVDNLWGNEQVMSYFGLTTDADTKSDLASKLKNLVWADTSDGRTLKIFHPSDYGDDNQETTPTSDVDVTINFLTNNTPCSFSADLREKAIGRRSCLYPANRPYDLCFRNRCSRLRLPASSQK